MQAGHHRSDRDTENLGGILPARERCHGVPVREQGRGDRVPQRVVILDDGDPSWAGGLAHDPIIPRGG